MCMECMHHMLLPQLKWEHDGVQATASVNFPLHHYASKQCTALEVIMDLLKVKGRLNNKLYLQYMLEFSDTVETPIQDIPNKCTLSIKDTFLSPKCYIANTLFSL